MPSPGADPAPPPTPLQLLRRYLLPRWRRAAILLALLLVGTGLELIGPLLLSRFIDGAVAAQPFGELLTLALLFVGVALLIQGGEVAQTALATDLGLRATNALRVDLARHCLELDLEFHGRHTPGSLIERLDGDAGRLANLMSRFAVDLLGNALLLIGVLIALFTVDWRVGGTLTLFALLTTLAIYGLRDVAVPYFRRAQASNAELFGHLEEHLAGSEDVRGNGAVPHVMAGFTDRSRTMLRAFVGAGLVGTGSYNASKLLFSLGAVAALGLGALLHQQGLATLGLVYLIFRYNELLIRPIQAIGRQIQDLQQAGAAALRIGELLAERSGLRPSGDERPPAGPLALRLRGVGFAYPGDAEATLDGVDLELPAGQTLGLLGRTGSGKTTLIRLLARFYDPDRGELTLGGSELHRFERAELRERVALVTQEVHLFGASVRDNLTLFRHGIDDARIVEVLELLGLRPWLDGLPDGLDTILAGGGGLSAGQGQLLAFARAFLRDPGLVLLDEASSRLDPATEVRLERAVTTLLRGRSAVIVAHRLATVLRADRIAILEGGRVVEQGRREALQADPDSRFAGLLRRGLDEVLS